MVDTLGMLLAVVRHPADIQDRDGAKLVSDHSVGAHFLGSSWSEPDSAYAVELRLEHTPWEAGRLEVVKRAPHAIVFGVAPR